MTLSLLFILLVTLGYLMGSICSAVIVCRMFNLPDPREEGSRNPGATNVLRLAGKQYAALVLVADILKGTIPVLIAKILISATMGTEEPTIVAFTALAAVVGHMYPLFFGFKGGKGVATAIGALLGLQFMVGIMVSATWLLVAKFTRFSSLASIIAIILSPFYALLLIHQLDIFPPLFIMVILVLFKHRNNITRLIDGLEPKIKFKRSVIDEIMETPPARPIAENEPVIDAVSPLSKEKAPTKKVKAAIAAKPKKDTTVKTTKAKTTDTAKKVRKTKVTKPTEK